MVTEAPRLPPPSWAFGYHYPLIRNREDIQELVSVIRGSDFNFPLEGFIQEQPDLENELALSVRKPIYDEESIDYL